MGSAHEVWFCSISWRPWQRHSHQQPLRKRVDVWRTSATCCPTQLAVVTHTLHEAPLALVEGAHRASWLHIIMTVTETLCVRRFLAPLRRFHCIHAFACSNQRNKPRSATKSPTYSGLFLRDPLKTLPISFCNKYVHFFSVGLWISVVAFLVQCVPSQPQAHSKQTYVTI